MHGRTGRQRSQQTGAARAGPQGIGVWPCTRRAALPNPWFFRPPVFATRTVMIRPFLVPFLLSLLSLPHPSTGSCHRPPPFPFPREKILPALRLTFELTQRFEFGGKLVRVSKAHPPTSTFRGAFWSAFEGIRIGSWILHVHHDVLGRSQFDRWRWKRPEWTAWRC